MRRPFYAVVGGCVLLLLVMSAIWPSAPGVKCGEIGYRPLLSNVCFAAQGHANSDNYCSADERHEIKCAAASRAFDAELEQAEMNREMYERKRR